MKTRMTIMMLGVVLLFAGIAGAQQILLPGALIPKFVDPLPVATTTAVPGITVVDARAGGADETPTADLLPVGAPDGINDNTFIISAVEFQAQILPSTGVPLAVPAIPANTPSWVWGYLTDADIASLPSTPPWRASYLGPVVVAQKGVPFYPEYINALPIPAGNVQQNLPIDQTLDWADPLGVPCTPGITCLDPYTGPIPIATHLHGGEVAPAYDGGPDAWFTPGTAGAGPGFPGNIYTYPNEQQESTIWFHDHALGITRLNVYAGLAGVYPIIDPAPNTPMAAMPAFPQYDIPLILQDRSFDTTGQIFYNLASNPQPNPTVHPFWIPEFIGDTIVVNGKTWPFLNVEPRQYRFRFVNGSNARFYELTLNMTKVKNLKVKVKNPTMPMVVIATDDGYLMNAVATNMLVIGPGERYEVIVDFSALIAGDVITMMNSARTPYPGGGKPVPGLTDTVMQFRVGAPSNNPTVPKIVAGTALRDPVTNPIQPIKLAHDTFSGPPPTGSITRQLTLNEVIGAGGPLELVVNNSKFNLAGILPGSTTPLGRETELPAVGDTEIWEIINITADAHPMHLHLVSFQVLDRTPFQAATWITQYDALLVANGKLPGGGPPNQYNVKNLDGAIGGNPAIGPFLQLNKRTLPLPYEMGWKDTVITYPGEVTRIAVRWATTDAPVAGTACGPCGPGTAVPPNLDTPCPAGCVPSEGSNLYSFNPTALEGPVGYVWHCHIIDHEDNEMMRNYVVGTTRQPVL
jgi:spore coat protein A